MKEHTIHTAEGRRGDMQTDVIHLPAPTAWPMLLAMGITLMFASLVMNVAVGALGLVLAVASAIGWFREVLPRERHEEIEVEAELVGAGVSQGRVAHIEVNETHRAQLPLRTFPVSSGLKGGIAGGIAMIIPAEAYSLLRFHSPWYVINLLGGAGVAGWSNPTMEEMLHFRLSALVTASIIHISTCLLVGLLYGAMLPIWPRRPVLL